MSFEDRTARAVFGAASHRAEAKGRERGSKMVEKDRPHPAPRPSLGSAHDVDRARFNAAWEREAREASESNRAARKEAFKAMRREADSPSRNFNRTAIR